MKNQLLLLTALLAGRMAHAQEHRRTQIAADKHTVLVEINPSAAAPPLIPCNLVPNPSFDQQNVTQLSGNLHNVGSVFNAPNPYNELTGWDTSNGTTPDYFASNSPTVATPSTPAQTHPTTSPFGQFTPYNYNPAPSAHNGTVGLYIGPNNNSMEYLTAEYPLQVSAAGAYYASFRAYCGWGAVNFRKLGVNFTTCEPELCPPVPTSPFFNYTLPTPPAAPALPQGFETTSVVTNAAWAQIAGVVQLTNAPYYINIGNFSPTFPQNAGSSYYYIDEVELYRIPTAGANKTCSSVVTIGEGCHIPGATYAWRIKPAVGQPQPTPFAAGITTTVSPLATTTYTLTVTLPNAGGLPVTPTAQYTTYVTEVTVQGCTNCTTPVFTVPTTTCSGNPLTFTASPGNNISWATSPAGAFTPASGTGSSFTTTPSSPTAITGTVTATRTICLAPQSFSSNIAIRPACPGPTNFPITQIQGQHTCLTNRCYYTFSITNPLGWPYNWSLDGSYSSTSIAIDRATPSPFVPLPTGNGPGTMTIYCVFRDPSGCCDDVVVPVQIWYDGIYGEHHRGSTIGGNTLTTKVYPNPANDYLTLPAGASQVEFRNAMGKPVLNSSQNAVDVQKLPDGLYSVTYLIDGKATTQRIQIKH